MDCHVGTVRNRGGLAPLPNLGSGVVVSGGVHHNLIGSGNPEQPAGVNVISGNYEDGVLVGSDNNDIGGSQPGDGNIISGNGGNGVAVQAEPVMPGEPPLLDPRDNLIAGNRIGTKANGVEQLENGKNGVLIRGEDNTVGGAGETGRNIISGNLENGVAIEGGNDNYVFNNYIGVGQDGSTRVANTKNGVYVRNRSDGSNNVGAVNSFIGMGTEATRNVTSGNGESGVHLFGEGVTGTRILGNYIGTAANGTTPEGNGFDGVYLGPGSSGATVGGAGEARNVISANGPLQPANNSGWGYGVQIRQSDDNRIEKNFIGLDKAGPNGQPNMLLHNKVDWRNPDLPQEMEFPKKSGVEVKGGSG